MNIRLAFAGFGVVAQGLTELLIEKKDYLKDVYDLDWTVVAISDFKKGSILNNDGLEMPKLLSLAKNNKPLEEYAAPDKGLTVPEMIHKANANMLVEATYTDVQTGQPATDHIKQAFQKGWHVVTTNKGPIINYGKELIHIAQNNRIGFGFEGVVMSGTPAISLVEKNLAGSVFTEIRGILNGTTNYILSEMEKDLDYTTALCQAQKLGYAEADPTGDVEGWDALGKIVILANLFMDAQISINDASRQGISEITPDNIREARTNDKRWKLIARCIKQKETLHVSVGPEALPVSDPLANIPGATNALTLRTDTLGDVTIIGAGAGKRETGYALLSDILSINHLY